MKLSMIQNLAIWGDSLLKGIIFDEKTSRYTVSYTHLIPSWEEERVTLLRWYMALSTPILSAAALTMF